MWRQKMFSRIPIIKKGREGETWGEKPWKHDLKGISNSEGDENAVSPGGRVRGLFPFLEEKEKAGRETVVRGSKFHQ